MKSIFGSLLLALATTASLPAALVVDFSTINGTGSVNNTTSLSLSTPDITSSDFSSAPPSPTVYSGVQSGRYVFIDRGEGTILEVGPASQVNLAAGYIWKKEDFLNGGDSAQVDITSSSRFTSDWTTRQTSGGQAELHWLFLQDGVIYVSDQGIGSDTSDTLLDTSNSGDLTALDWSSIGLTTDTNADPVAASPDFTDIEGVGVYWTSDFASGGDDAVARGFWWQSFDADVSVIPEPSSAFLLFSLGSLWLLVYRGRR